MATTEKTANTVQQVKGTVLPTAGAAVGNKRLLAEGKAEQKRSHLKQAGEHIKDVLK